MAHRPTDLTLTELAAAFRSGAVSPTDATETVLARLDVDEAVRVVTAERARAQARRAERAFEVGVDLGPLQGAPIAIKDLIDMEGEISAAGSRALLERGRVADRDAPVVARLDAAGAVFVARTQMTELAFSGLGMNPHFGTPGSVPDPERVAGGSSSGSAVAVARGDAFAALGSDTGGSVRIPAAFNRLVGLKPTDGALPMEGTVPLSTTLDTIGPIARTLDDVWSVWRALRGRAPSPTPRVDPDALRLLVPETVVQDDLDPEVALAFEAALSAAAAAGCDLDLRPVPELDALNGLYPRYGGFAAHEALVLHEELLAEAGDALDPRVARRILAVRERPARDYVALRYARERLGRAFWERAAGYDAVLTPTVACLAPAIRDLQEDDDAYARANALVLRNTTLFNLLGGPAVTVPIGAPDGPAVGGGVATAPGREAHAIAVAAAWQQALADAGATA